MSENNKKQAPKATDNDDLLGDAQTPEQIKKAADDKKAAAAKKATTPKVSAAEQKKIKAAQGSDENDFVPKENERGHYHVKMEKKVFSPSTGEKLTKDYVQIYSIKEWKAYLKNGKGLGFTCTVLWNPENYK